MTRFKFLAVATLAIAAATSAQAAAPTVYQYDWTTGANGAGGSEAGSTSGYGDKMTDYTVTYDTASQNLRLDVDMNLGQSELISDDGFWLVLNGGGMPGDPAQNPKGTVNEIVILYGDLSTGTTTAYIYDGNNNPGSYGKSSNYLGSYANSITFDETSDSFTLNLNATSLNSNTSADNKQDSWRGLNFTTDVGIWYHPTSDAKITYNSNGTIKSYGDDAGASTGWYDTGTRKTTSYCNGNSDGSLSTLNLSSATNGQCASTKVPEPASLALLGAGLVGLGLARRRKQG